MIKNYIFCVLDSVRYDYFDKMYETILEKYTPFSKIYHNVWSSSCWTIPAVGSLITGLSPLEHGATLETDCNLNNVETVYDYFSSKGYKNYYLSENLMFNQSFLTTLKTDDYNAEMGEHILEKGSSILEKINQSANPFFLYIHFMDAHRPYPEVAPIDDELHRLNNGNGWKDVYLDTLFVTKDMSAQYLKMYERGVKDTLDNVVKLFKTLETKLSNTVIVVISDHGEMLGEKGLYDHQFNLENECVRIPLMVFDKSRSPSCHHDTKLRSICDVFDFVVKGESVERDKVFAYYGRPDQLLRTQKATELYSKRPDLLTALLKTISSGGVSVIERKEYLFEEMRGIEREKNVEIEQQLESLGYL